MELILYKAHLDKNTESLPNTPEINARIASCQKMVFGYAMKTHVRFPRLDLDDIVSRLQRTLWRAACKWEPGRGTKFSSWACNAIRLECRFIGPRALLRKTLPTKAIREGFLPVRRGDVLTGLIDEQEDEERRSRLRREIAKLDEKSRRVIKARRLRGLTLQEAGDEVGLSKERVRQIENQVMARLREKLGPKE